MTGFKPGAKYIDGHWYLPVEDYDELREALSMAIYHGENLGRIRNHIPVRDFSESAAGFAKARRLLESLADAA